VKKFLKLLAATSLALAAATSHAALYTNSFGANAGTPSDCDDCFSGPWSFGGGQSINFFGNNYGNLFVGSNGYVTFGAGATSFSTSPLNTQTIAPMIAGSYTDLDSRNDATSNVYVNTSTPGQIIATWDRLGHYAENYSVRSLFQLVIRSDQFLISAGEGQIGFFYDEITDGSSTSAGFGDGLSAINAGEVAFASLVSGTNLSNNAPRWYNLENGVPDPVNVPEPGSIALLGLGMSSLAFLRRRKKST
jgi:hypothetical protein